jgi:NifU-like protein involved in Fe-S cluster formation
MFLRTARRRVEEVRFVTDGCIYTLAACSVAAELAEGRSLGECLGMRADDILGCLRDMPEDHRHCAEIAVLTLRKAVRNSLIRGSGDWKRAYRPITKP